MFDLTNGISNDQNYHLGLAGNSAPNNNNAARFSEKLGVYNGAPNVNPNIQGNAKGNDLQASFSNLLSGKASDEDISTMQNALFDSLKQALFKDNANTTAVLNQKETTFVGETTTTSETSNTFWELVDSASTLSFGEDGLGLDDAFDAVNVLNHIPIVSDIYKDATSQEKTDAAASVVGGYMFAGPIGALYSAANVVTEEITGSSILDNLISFGRSFLNDEQEAVGTTQDTTPFETPTITGTTTRPNAAAHEFVTRSFGKQGV